MSWLIAFFTFSGITVGFWSIVAVVRWVSENVFQIRKGKPTTINITLSPKKQMTWNDVKVTSRPPQKLLVKKSKENPEELVFSINLEKTPMNDINVSYGHAITVGDVAVIVPAHNEEAVIASTLQSLMLLIEPEHIYVGSDASTDKTVEIGRSFGANVADIQPNRGKAGVLKFVIDHFKLVDRYKVVLIVDADTVLDKNYLKYGLPLFDDPEVVAVAGHAVPLWAKHRWPKWSMLFTAYRVRLYILLQAILRYPQTWSNTNVASIIPGSNSMYRTRILPKINITAPGLVIEDFNMTFEVQHKKLGKIAYLPSVYGIDQEPQTYRDYYKQVKRWNLGFWQTVRHHGLWPSFFCLSLGIFQIEMILFSVFLVTLPFLLLGFFFTGFESYIITPPSFIPFTIEFSFAEIFFTVFLMDYFMTIIIAIITRKPSLLLYGLLFSIIRVSDAYSYLYAIPEAFFAKSDGKWVSPKRVARAV